jgi:hypothetical protein
MPARFSVSAYGSVPLTYQWKKNGVNIADATKSSLTITNTVAGDAGNYSVGVSNSLGGLVSSSAALTVLPVPTSPPAIPGLVLHLPFNNNLTDATGRGNNGTSINMTATTSNTAPATFVTDGAIGQAYHYESQMGSFPGPTTTNTSFVTLGVRPDLQFSSNVNFTIAFWMRMPLNFTGGDLPFFTTTVGSTFGSGIVLAPSYGDTATVSNAGTDPGGWAYSIYDLDGNGVGYYGDIGSLNDGLWHHLAYVVQRGVGCTVYLDGVAIPDDAFLNHQQHKQAGSSAAAAANIDTGNAATIGQDPTGTYGETGSGDMDDLGVWKRALTSLEVSAIYLAGASNKVSFTSAPITVSATKTGSTLTVNWSAGVLQQASSPQGPYTDVPGATQPYSVTIPAGAGAKYYRARL